MAGTTAPLFGFDASGTVAGSLVFSKWRGRTYVRRHAVPKNPKSGLQVGMRSVFKFTAQDWKNLSAALQQAWEDEDLADNITGLNSQQRASQRQARINKGWLKGPNETPLTTIDAPTIDTVTAQPKGLVLDWTRPLANQGDYTVAIYRSTTTGFTEDISNLIAVLPVTDLTFTDTGLTTGTEYFYKIRETSGAGELGTISAQNSGTPT